MLSMWTVESVRFTGDKIGLDGDTAIMQLTTAGSIGKVTIDGTVEMIDDTTSLTHTGTTSLAISSTNGHVTIAGGADDYVDVESVRFTDAAIGTTGDADLVTLEDNKVTIKGTLTTTDDILMSEETAALTHDSDTGVGLAITSTNGYVDVEQVRFTDDQIGLAGTEGLVTLSSSGVDIAGSLDTDGHFKVADTKFTIDVSGNTYADGTLGVKGLSTLQNNLELSKTDAAIKHTGTGATTGLTISSDNGYVDVESVRFTDATIGTTDDPGLISLTDTDVTVTGTLTVSDNVKLTEDNAVIEHTSTASGASLTIKSNSGYVDVESVRFTGDQIGLDSDTAIMQLTTDGSVGNVAVDGTVTMIDDATSLTHTGATSLTISSSQAAAFVKIQGGSAAYVQVESVKITDNQIGTVNDANLITLEDDKMSLDGALDLKNEDATITHTASTGTPTLTISSTSGPVSVVSTAQYVEVESVRFTGDQIGLDGDTAIMQLTTANSVGNVAVDGTVTMIDDATSLTHTGATSLTISSSQAAAFVKIQGGSAAYVQVESVKITDDQIGTVSDANLITLEDDKMSLDGALDLKNEDATITHTASTGTPMLTISSTNGPVSVVSNAQYVEVESVRFTGDQIGLDSDTAIMQLTTDGSVGNVAIDGTVTMIDDVTSLTHTGATSLAISSTNGHITIAGGSNDYVDVESVRFTGDQIGLDGDTAIMQLTTANSVGNVAIDGTVTMIDDVTSLTHTGTTSLAISSTNGHITIAGGSDDYVDVESVRFTNDYIGISTDTDIIQLTSTGSQATVAIVADVDVTGTMDVSSDFEIGTDKFKVVEQTGAVSMISDAQTITHDGATSLTISSSQAAAFVKIEGGSAAYVQVESVKITDNQIGTVSDANLITLEDDKMSLDGALDLKNEDATITHTASTGTPTLTISSTNGPVSVVSDAQYVDIESVRFTGDKIGLDGDTAIMQLTTDGSVGNVAIDGTVTMIDDVTSLTHTGATSLAISSTNGHITIAGGSNDYVDIESVRFTGDKIGLDGDTAIMQLTTAGSVGNVAIDGTVTMIDDATSLTHTGATSLAISSTNGHITIAGGSNDYVDIESVRFTNDYIGISTDTDIIQLTSTGSQATVAIVADVDVTGTMDVSSDFAIGTDKFKVVEQTGAVSMISDAQTITHDGATSLTISSSQAAAFVKIEGGSAAYVQVESVKITDDQIGTVSDANLITLEDDKMSLDGALDLKNEDATITHTASTGTPTLTISSTNGPVSVVSDAQYVDVESVRFTGDKIGLDGDTAIMQLTTAGSVGNVAIDGTVTMIDDATSLTHTGATSLAISSTNGHITIAGGSNDYVDIESVRFTNDYIGISTDTDIIQLTSTGSQATVAIVADVDVTGTMDVSSDFEIGTDKFKVVEQTGAVSMISDAQTITHDGATSLTISSSQAAAFVKIEGGSAAYVQVESVKITDNQIGTVSDANLITLEDDKMSLDGALDLKNEDATITHTASTGTPTLTISSTNGPVSVVSNAQYVDVELVRFTGDQIGLDGDTAIIQLTTDGSVGNVAVDGTVTMIDDATSLTHTGATSLTISSSQAAAFVKIQGGSAAYVQVESVKITDNQIGTVSDANLITLEDDKMSLDGALDLTNEDATITHTASTGTPTLTISSTNGPVSVVSDAQYVDVESVRFTGDQIGSTGDPDLITLTNNNIKLAGTVEMSVNSAALTHSGTTSLAISSTNGYVTIAGGSGATDYVDVESVRFTNDYIGISGDTDIIQLTSTGSQATVAIVADVDVTGTMDVSSDFAIGTDKFKVVEQTGAVSMSSAAQTITHDGATSLTISSSQAAAFVKIEGGSAAYVQVESVKITDNQIGTVSDANLITLEDDKMSLDGALDLTNEDATITHTASTGTPTLTISSTNGPVSVVSNAQYVDVELVRFTDSKIGTTNDADLITLADDAVTVAGVLQVSDDFKLSEISAAITHTAGTVGATTGLTISSTAGFVDVESVRFTDDPIGNPKIGTTNDADLITLSDNAVELAGTLTVTDDLKLSKATAALTHTASTGGLAITSNDGYVDVESVRFTETKIGITGDTDIITLSSASVAVAGALGSTGDFNVATTAFTVAALSGDTAVGGTLSVTGASTLTGAASLSSTLDVGGATTLTSSLDVGSDFKVAGTKFTVDSNSGDTVIAGTLEVQGATVTLSSSLGLNGAATISDDITMTKQIAAITHNQATGGLAITSTYGYVDVESLRVTGNVIGLSTDVEIITLADGAVAIDGTLDTTGDFKIANTKFTVDSVSGNTAVAGTLNVTGAASLSKTLAVTQAATLSSTLDVAGNLKVAQTKFTVDSGTGNTYIAGNLEVQGTTEWSGDFIVSGSASIPGTLSVGGISTFADDILMTETTAALTHNAATGGLAITSSSGYVDVESVRFTGNIIGLDGDFDIITLQNAAVTIDGSLSASGDFKIATTMFTVDANSGDASVYGGLTAGGAATVGGTLDVTGGVTLGNSLSVTGSATLGSSLGVSGDFKVATDKFTVDTSGNVEVAGTLDVTSDTTLTGALDLTGAATLRNDITMTKTDATLTHTPSSGGLTLQSTYGYVAVEDVRFTGNVIGISTDSDIITLTNAAAEVDGALSASGDFSIATTAFTVASSSGDTSIGGALDVTAATTLQDSLTVSGVTTVSNTLTVTQGASLLGTLNVGGTFSVATTKFTVDASNGDTVTMGSLNVGAAATLDSTLSLNGVATLANDISMSKTAAKLTHTASQSLTSGLTISSEDGFVDIEQVRFNANEIGVAGDTDLITLSSGAVVVAATLSSTDDFSVGSPATFTVDAQTGNTDATGYLKASGPTTLSNTLTVTGAATLSDDLQVDGATTMSGTVTAGGDFKVITSGSEMFAVVASSGDTTVAGTLSVTQATNLDSTLQVAQGTTLSSTLAVDGAATMKDNILMEKASAAITHNYASGGLDITSDNGYVGVEDVRFTGSNIGTSADDDLITIAAGSVTIRGTLDTTGATTGIRVATDKFTVDAAGNTAAEGTLGVTGVTTLGSTLTVSGATTLSSGLDVTGTSTLTGSLEVTGTTTLGNDISLDKTDAVITHTATTSDTTGLTIKSTYGYVQIEDMRFTGKKLGIAADTDLITLADGSVTIAGTVSATDDFSVGSSLFTVDAQTGNTAATGTLGVTGATTLTSTLGVGGATTLSNTLTVAQGATLSNTLNVALDATLQKNLIMSDTAAALTHSGTTGGLTIKSTNGYVDVEDMRFTDKKLGISTDPDLITLSAGAMTVAGTLSATDDFSVATTKFTVDAQTGDTKVEGTFDVTGATTLGHTLGVTGATTLLSTLDVSGTFKVSTKFTVDSGSGNTDVDGTLGVTAATTLSSTLSVQSDATLKNSLLMSKAAAAITHTASSGGLIISSTAGYVNVEDIRFTGATIGTSGDPDLISLADGHATVTGKLTANDDFSVATTGKFTVTAATGDTSVGGTLDVTAATTLSDTLTVTQGATLSDTLNVALDATLQKNLIMSDTAATLRHSAATGGLTITSASGYVDVESVRFKEKFIGISSDDNLIGLESGAMTVAGTLSLDDDFSVATTKFTVDAQTGDTAVFGTFDVTGEATLSDTLTVAQGATLSSTLNVAGVATMQNGVIMSAADASLTHSGNTGLKIKSTLAHVDVEDIRFSGTQIGISSDDNLISLASGAVTVAGTLSLDDDFRVATTKFTVDAQTGDTAVSGTFGVTGEATLSDTLTVTQGATLSSTLNVAGVATMQNDIVMEETAASLTHTAPSGSTSGLTIKSTYGFVDVESVRFTGAKIGVGADIDLLSLASGALTVAGTLESNGDLTVSSTNFKVTAATGDTSVGGTLDVTAATTLADTLTVTQGTTLSNTLDVALDATLQKNLIMSDTAATLRHTAASGGLTITSASGYVDVESVRFTGNTFGTTTDSDLVSLADDAVTITGTLDTTADFRVATDKFTVDASGNTAAAGTLGVSGATSLSDTLTVFQDTTLKTDLLMSSATAALTHTATTGGLTIKSTSRYVDVESIRFTAAKIGIAADDDLVNLANGAVTISGTLDATGTFKVATNMFSVDSGSGNTAVAGTLGVDGATTLSDTLNVAEDMTLQKNIIMSDTAAALTHSGASGGLTISSSNANGHVDVQSVRFTAGGKMGISTDDDIITLSSGAVAVAGTLTVSDDVKLSETYAALTHTAGSGGLAITSEAGYVDVESVRFTETKIGITGDIDIITLSSASVAVAGALGSTGDFNVATTSFTVAALSGDTAVGGDLTAGGTLDVTGAATLSSTLSVAGVATMKDDIVMEETAASLTHTASSGTPGLTIKSTFGFVDVESVRFTDAKIGVNGDPDLLSLASGALTVAGTFDTTADIRVATNKFTVDASGNTAVEGTLGVTGVTTLSNTVTIAQDATLQANLKLESETAAITHTATTGGLTIKSTSRYVDVESVRFTAAKIGIAADDDLVNLANGAVTISGTLDATGTFKVATNMFSVDSGSGNTAVAGTLEVDGATTLSDTLDVSGATTVSNTLTVTQAATMQGTLGVSGAATLSSSLAVAEDFNVNGDKFSVAYGTGNTIAAGTMSVGSDFTVAGTKFKVDATSGDAIVAGKLTVNGVIDTTSDFSVGTTEFTVAAATGNTEIAGTLSVDGAVALGDDITMSKPLAALTHSGVTGLAITSTGYVEVESVRFTGSKMGISSDDDIITLSSGAVAVAGFLTVSNDLKLSEDAAKITHTAPSSTSNAGLAISSANAYVDVESVRFTDAQIGTTGDADLITLADGSVTIAGVLDTTADFSVATTAFTVASSTGNTAVGGTFTVTGATTLSSTVDVTSTFRVATNKFTVDTSGNTLAAGTLSVSGATTMDSTLNVGSDFKVATDKFSVTALNGNTAVGGTLGVTGAATLSGTLDVTQTFRVATSMFTVEHSSGNTVVAGTLGVDGAVALGDDITMSKPLAALTHSGATGLAITSSGYVDVQSVRFTAGGKMGISTDDDIITLSSGAVAVAGTLTVSDDVKLSETYAALTHTAGSGGLAITSEAGYVDVESVRFTETKIGITGDIDIITLSSASVAVAGALGSTGDFNVATTAFTVAALSGDTAVGGDLTAGGTLDVTGAATLRSTLDVTGATTLDSLSVSGASTLTGAATLQSTLDVSGDTTLSGELTVSGVSTISNTLTVAQGATLQDSLTVEGEAILSDTLTVNGATTLSDTLDVTKNFKVASTKFTVDSSTGNTAVDGTLTVADTTTLQSGFLMTETAAAFTHSATTVGATTGLTISSTVGFVDVEDVRFTNKKIGISGDDDLITLGSAAVTIDGTLSASDDFTVAGDKFSVDATTGNSIVAGTLTAQSSLGVTGAATMSSTLDVTEATTLLNTLSVGQKATMLNDIDMSKQAAAITHTATTGGLTIKSTNTYVDVELIRFTDKQLGIDGDPDLIALDSGAVIITGTLDTTADFKVATDKFVVDAAGNTAAAGTLGVTGATTLDSTLGVGGITTLSSTLIVSGAATLSSTLAVANDFSVATSKFQVASGTGNTVVAGTLNVGSDFKVATDKFTVDTSGNAAVAGTLSVTGATTIIDDITMSKATALIDHTGSGGLTIKSAGTVSVEDVRFTANKIGIVTDDDLISLADNAVTISGTMTTSGDLMVTDNTKFAVYASNGNTVVGGTLGVTGAATLSGTLDVTQTFRVATSMFTVEHSSGNTVVAGTLAVDGGTTLKDSVSLLQDAATITHTAAFSATAGLTISSTNAHVDVESVRFTGSTIGVANDADLVTLGVSAVTIAGTVTSTHDLTVVDNTKFQVTADNGNTAVGGTLGVTGATTLTSASLSSTLGVGGATTLSDTLTVTQGATLSNTLNVALDATLQKNLIMSDTAAALTHSAATGGLTIKSTNGYVDVEQVRFTDKAIGIDVDPDLVNLENGAVTISGSLSTTGNFKVASTKFTVDYATGDTGMTGTLTVSDATTLSSTLDVNGAVTLSDTVNVALDATLQGDLIMDHAAAALTHSAATGGLTIKSTNGYVDVEQIRFADRKIGTSADAELITLATGQVSIGGTLKLDSTGDVEVAKALASITHTGGTGMAISSTSGYVDIESVRFDGSAMGPTGDPDLVTLASGALTIAGTLSTSGTFTVNGNKFSVASDTGNTAVLGNLGVTGAATLSSSLAVNSDFTVAGDKFKVTASSGDTTVAGTFTSSGDATMSGALGVSGVTTMASTLNVGSDFKVATDKFSVTALTGNTVVGGTLGVTGAATLSGTLDVTSDFKVATSMFTVASGNGNTAVGGTLTVTGAASFADSVSMSETAATFTHTGTTGLTISSSGYVDVEQVRFNGKLIGVDGDTDLLSLESGAVTVAGRLNVNGDTDLSGGNVMTSYHAATASSGGVTIPAGTTVCKITGSVASSFSVSVAGTPSGGQLMFIRNDSDKATSGLALNAGEGGLFVYHTGAWHRII